MYIPIPRSTFWQNCIFGLLVDISSLSLPQILVFSSSVLLTRLILTSRNSYCLVHHLDSITRLLIILIVREKKEWERVRERECLPLQFSSSSFASDRLQHWQLVQLNGPHTKVDFNDDADPRFDSWWDNELRYLSDIDLKWKDDIWFISSDYDGCLHWAAAWITYGGLSPADQKLVRYVLILFISHKF